ncbi:MAG: sulfur oxidation c-type cytochrome SoxA [Betaproteobacteria bacterium]|nr:sulfur oxidation c-type cytochrome SoxA [Betaproteobacteria bacterium]
MTEILKKKQIFGFALCLGLLLSGFSTLVSAQQRFIPLDQLKSGLDYASNEVRGLQLDDDFSSLSAHGIDKGAQLWKQVAGSSNKSCESCHGEVTDSMKGVSARYPAVDKSTGKLFNLEDRIRQCRQKNQKASNWALESDELLAMTLQVNTASKGMPIKVSIDGPAKKHFEAGLKLYMARQGQLNLSCTQCHDQHHGQRLFNDKLSQGQPNGYPIYRLDWQYLASLERRLRFCYASVRAELPAWGHVDMRNIELYLKWRAEGLLIEVPAVRK